MGQLETNGYSYDRNLSRDDADCRVEPLVTVSNHVTRSSVFSNTSLVGCTDAL